MDDICSNWEEIADNTSMLDKQLEKLRLERAKETKGKSEEQPKIRILARVKPDANANSKKPTEAERIAVQISQPTTMVMDSTRDESMRSQYVPPVRLLTRPKAGDTQGSDMNGGSSKTKHQQPVKTLEQREKEYMEARKRILGDVQFDEPEDELSTGSDGSGLSPAEVLKQKIAQVLKDGDEEAEGGSEENGSSGEAVGEVVGPSKTKSKSRGKKNREKFKTSNPESPRDFPVSKTDSERIVRQPRGPDGTQGFHR